MIGVTSSLLRLSSTRRRSFMRRLAGLCLVCFTLGLPSVAEAAPVPGGLDHELFFHSGFVTEGVGNPGDGGEAQNCVENGTSTVRFKVAGAATGPYPGTFTENGTLTIGPQTLSQQNVSGTLLAGPVLTFTANFTITSGATTVTGTKTLSASSPTHPTDSVGACASFENSTNVHGIFDPNTYATLSGRSYMADVSSTYVATINTPSETIQDTGNASTFFNETYLTGGTCLASVPPSECSTTGAGSNGFAEGFDSVVRQCSDGLDNDGDGKSDYPADPGCSSSTDDSESPDPTPPRPTTEAQCKKDGWKIYGVFKNQGDCVSYVATHGKNEPGQNQPNNKKQPGPA